jgi:hypothetical protein
MNSQGEFQVLTPEHITEQDLKLSPVAKSEPVALSPAAPTPMQMLQMAVQSGANVDILAKLMDLSDRHQATEARRAFVEAMSAFKSHSIQVVKDKTNKQYESKYVSIGNLVNTVTPFLSQHGLSVRWDIDQTAGIKVTCVITHVQGHSESVAMVCPPDTSGAKNPIQQIKSAITYGKACTFESICGLASSDANLDDDGNGASNGELSEQVEYLANAKDLAELEKLFWRYYNPAKAAKDKRSMSALIAAKDARKGELL